jgi:hypothetical protein
MPKTFCALAIAAFIVAFGVPAQATPGAGSLSLLATNHSNVTQAHWRRHHRHHRCWWRHGHRHCRWWW